MRDEQSRIVATGARLVVIGNGEPWQARAFREEQEISFDLWVDPEMVAYRAAGLRRGIASTLSARSVGHAWRALRSGARHSKVQGDPWQLGGAFIISTAGKTVFKQISREAGDHAKISEIIPELEALTKQEKHEQ